MTSRRYSSQQVRVLFEELLKDPEIWRHGYELLLNTHLLSGTLYPLLIRLHEQGVLEARWEEASRPGRPPRHAYRLTVTGLIYARDTLADAASKARLKPGRGRASRKARS
jgi:PadR family transcriptional regulator PadR